MEAIRQFVRARIGATSATYRFAARVADMWSAVARGGTAGLRLIALKRRSGPGVWIHLPPLARPILVRPGTDDVGTVINNVLREEYGQLPGDMTPTWIVDAGAYIGDTSAYFLSRYPEARVIAIEPNADNAALAERNLALYNGRAALLRCALWGSKRTVGMVGRETRFAVSSDDGDIPTIDVPALLADFNLTQIDVLKMDIEGAEVDVLRSGVGGWLRRVRLLLLETHGSEIEQVVLPLLADEGFSLRRHRNVWYCMHDPGRT